MYNSDHQNHVNNGDATQLGGYSGTVSQMQSTTSPGDAGTEALATVISDELARIRYVLAAITGGTNWYASGYPNGCLAGLAYGVFD